MNMCRFAVKGIIEIRKDACTTELAQLPRSKINANRCYEHQIKEILDFGVSNFRKFMKIGKLCSMISPQLLGVS